MQNAMGIQQNVAVFGITGRMGQCLVRALAEATLLRLSGAGASASSQLLGLDASLGGAPSGVKICDDPQQVINSAAVALDFSLPQALVAHAKVCAAARLPLLVGATGFDAATRAALESAAASIPVLIAPNTSLGVAVLARLAAVATQALGAGYDVEIAEAHHRHKRDAPSGTALALGEAVAAARGAKLAELAEYNRHGEIGPRQPGQIGFSVVRGGDIVGEHTVIFAGDGERLEVTHRATDRMSFAHGALRAAAWLIGQPPGLYNMADSLELMDTEPRPR
jgi:4-hydroxy-tetrahydrodipicolinate reductase